MIGKKSTISDNWSPWVLQELRQRIPENRARQDAFYLPCAQKALEWFGPLSRRPGFADNTSHIEVLLLFAAHGMENLNTSNFRAWSSAQSLLDYQRMLFIRTLVIGAGTYSSRNVLLHPTRNEGWNPIRGGAGKFFGNHPPRRRRSNAYIPSSHIEQAVFHNLFGDVLRDPEHDSMATMAAIGAFDAPSDPFNPIVGSMRRGIRKAIQMYQMAPGSLIAAWIEEWAPGLLDGVDLTELPDAGDDVVEEIDGPEEAVAQPALPRAKTVAGAIQAAIGNSAVHVSRPGAPIHAMSGTPLVIWPLGLEALAACAGLGGAAELEAVMADNGWIHLTDAGDPVVGDFAFVGPSQRRRKAILANVKAVPLTDQGAKALLPEGRVADNPKMMLLDEAKKWVASSDK